jgi:hypothetical protein
MQVKTANFAVFLFTIFKNLRLFNSQNDLKFSAISAN